LALDRLGLEEYVTFHGVCFSFIGCLGRESHNLWLGNPSYGSQPTLSESRHLYSFHLQPYCLDGIRETIRWYLDNQAWVKTVLAKTKG
jgi:hypothetical protein